MHMLLLKFIIHKTPKAIAVTKVKGHAAQEQVDDVTVTAQDKEGNEWADEAANKGARDVETPVSEMAATYSKKNGQYKAMMERIHKFIVHMKKAERQMRSRKEMQSDPFQDTAKLGGGN